MNKCISAFKNYFTTDRKYIATGIAVCVTVVALGAVVALFVYNSTPKVTYQPVSACDLFSKTKAQKLLGGKAIASAAQSPVVSDNTATSKCGYTDGNPDMDGVMVAAIIVRSGVNDAGVQQNKTQFSIGRPKENTETVKNIGDSAYFNRELGQLNILHGREWIILSYGIGSAPQANTLNDAVKLANEVLPAHI